MTIRLNNKNNKVLPIHKHNRHRHRHKSPTTRTDNNSDYVIQATNKKKARQQSNINHKQPYTTKKILSLLLISIILIIINPLASDHWHLYQQHQVLAFNIDTQSALIFSHQGKPGSYFGFSVAQHRDRGVPWLLIGAPKVDTAQPKTQQAGAVYRCSPTNTNSCQQIPHDPNGSSTIKLRGEVNQTDDKSYQWFGASIYSANDNGTFVACAPRYVYYSVNLKRRDPVGTCWVSRGSFAPGFLEYSPCRQPDQWGHHHLGSCQAGFSSALTKDGSRLFMGAPGAHVWQGQVFSHDLKTDMNQSTSGVNPHSEDDSLLGYSLALGRFSPSAGSTSGRSQSTSGSETDVAIGIPRADDTAGRVMVVDGQMRNLFNLTGEQVGSRFGESLAVLDINQDGLDDLVVGAPYFYNNSKRYFDRGRVYVYLQNIRHELNLVQKIDGQHDGGRLGTSIASAGDLNRDGFMDVAIGAPYGGPEGRGAVYIFMGRKQGGFSEEPDQIIAAETLRNEAKTLRGFGYSLSGGNDMDGNQYPDLLVGSYASDRAVLLRTRPVVNVQTSINFTPRNFNLDDKSCSITTSNGTLTTVPCITVRYCAKYSGYNVDSRLPLVFDIKLDSETKGAPRLFFLNQPEGKSEDQQQMTLARDTEQCKSFKAYISRQIRDKLTPLKVDIDYNILESASDTYDQNNLIRLKPVLNKSGANQAQNNKLSESASIQKNCGQDNICVPDLKLTVTPNMDPYVIGSDEKLILDVTVKNLGEDAFESMFYLEMPNTINYITINKTRSDYPICYPAKPDQTGINLLACDIGNPMVRNDVLKFFVITEPAKGVFTTPDFTFEARVNSTNPELDDRHREDNRVGVGIMIRVETNLVLSGVSQPPDIVYNSTAASEAKTRQKLVEWDIGQEIYHVYTLLNKGPSTISDIALTILWPSKNSAGQHLLYLVDEPITKGNVRCRPSPEKTINPLNLKYMQGNSPVISRQQQRLLLDDEQHQPQGIFRYVSTQQQRQKRQTYGADQNGDNLQSTTSQSQQQQQATTTTNNMIASSNLELSPADQQLHMNCGASQCDRFYCNIINLGNQEMATIKIRSRLYDDTLNYLSLQEFEISSKLVAQVKSLPYNVSTKHLPPYIQKVETQIHTTGLGVKDLLSWWLLLLAIILGLFFLFLLALCLKNLGFFDRRRPPKGKAEREPLTPTLWNNYQYTPGDTAL